MTETTDSDEVVVTRAEEQLRVTTTPVAVRRARIRKVVVSEERTITVTVRREEFRLDYQSVDPATEPVPSAPPAPIELVLHEEQVTLVKTVVPVERVRVDVRSVTEDRTVTEAVRSERVDVSEGPIER